MERSPQFLRQASYGVALLILSACTAAQNATPVPSLAGSAGFNAQAHGYKVLYTFYGSADGAYPQTGLIAVGNRLWGTTNGAGSDNDGTIFTITPAGSETVKHSFDGSDGEKADAPLTSSGGVIFGTTEGGGKHSKGTVFEVNGVKGFDSLYSFGATANDGQHPRAGVTIFDGLLYGTTYLGGKYGYGTAYEIEASGTEKVIAEFGKSSALGERPTGNLLAHDNKLYGLTYKGGLFRGGVAFTLTSSGKEGLLHEFGKSNDGEDPDNAALLFFDGSFYGTTCYGGKYGGGVVFELSSSGKEHVIYDFGGTKDDGFCPAAGLISYKGLLYGTTLNGGSGSSGTVFAISPLGIEEILHSFQGEPDGSLPEGALTLLRGKLYGTTSLGGSGFGTVFTLNP